MKPIYLDYNATTPIDPEVVDAMLPYLTEKFGNPSSSHFYGKETKQAVEKAREQLAALINCQAEEIIFTCGGTESNNYALKGTAFHLKHIGNHIITSCIEHPAIIEVCNYLEKQGFNVSYLPVDQFGMVSIKDLENEIKKETILISIMHANNEIGTLQPIEEIGQIAKKHHIRFHTDAAQSIGKVEVDVQKMGVNLLSIAGHKVYAPKGIGALYLKKGTLLEKFMHGANHEQNLRAGTENVLEIVGLGEAAEIAKRDFDQNLQKNRNLKKYFYEKLSEKFPDIHLNGHPEKTLPNTLSISFPSKQAALILANTPNIAASAGAACHSDKTAISSVLKAINLPENLAMGTIRFSVGKFLSQTEIDIAIEEIVIGLNKC